MRVIDTAVLGVCVTSVLLATGIGSLGQSPAPSPGGDDFARYAMKLRENAVLKIEPEVFLPATNQPGFPGFAGRYPWKKNIVTEMFWVGEPATGSSSAWDPEWERHYGGPDDPKASARHDYIPNNFTPKLNPFYCSLPYNDVEDSTTKPLVQGSVQEIWRECVPEPLGGNPESQWPDLLCAVVRLRAVWDGTMAICLRESTACFE